MPYLDAARGQPPVRVPAARGAGGLDARLRRHRPDAPRPGARHARGLRRPVRARSRRRGLGLVLDIVPNHMAASVENPWWRDVLTHGRASAFAAVFDVDWEAPGLDGRLLVPVLGHSAGAGAGRRRRHGRPAGGAPRERPRAAHAPRAPTAWTSRRYLLAHWRDANARVDYRRFFDIPDLVGVRVDDPSVFELTHALILDLVARRAASRACASTTSTACATPSATSAACATRSAPASRSGSRRSSAPTSSSRPPGRSRARRATSWPRRRSTRWSTRRAWRVLRVGVRAVNCPTVVPRSVQLQQARRARPPAGSGRPPRRPFPRRGAGPRARVAGARAGRRRRRAAGLPDLRPAGRRHRGRPDAPRRGRAGRGAARRAAARAAGRVGRRAALPAADEPGDGEGRRGHGALPPHRARRAQRGRRASRRAAGRARGIPGGCSPPGRSPGRRRWRRSATHDSKRGPDVRARLLVLAELGEEWLAAVRRFEVLEPDIRPDGAIEIDANARWLLWQTLVGAWPLEPSELPAVRRPRARLRAQGGARGEGAHVAGRSPTRRTSAPSSTWWRVRSTRRARCSRRSGRLVERVAWPGAVNGLSLALLLLAAPGLPDIYQGTERWSFSLVDPDNRRPVDLAALDRDLAALSRRAGLVAAAATGATVGSSRPSSRARSTRAAPIPISSRAAPSTPLDAGPDVLAFARELDGRWAVCAVPRSPLRRPPSAPRAGRCRTARRRGGATCSKARLLDGPTAFASLPVTLLVGAPTRPRRRRARARACGCCAARSRPRRGPAPAARAARTRRSARAGPS